MTGIYPLLSPSLDAEAAHLHSVSEPLPSMSQGLRPNSRTTKAYLLFLLLTLPQFTLELKIGFREEDPETQIRNTRPLEGINICQRKRKQAD